MGDEAEHLESQSDGGASEVMLYVRIQAMYEDYCIAKKTRAGQMVRCPCCGKFFKKKVHSQAFCSNGRTVKGRSSCKDRYWNTVNPARQYRWYGR